MQEHVTIKGVRFNVDVSTEQTGRNRTSRVFTWTVNGQERSYRGDADYTLASQLAHVRDAIVAEVGINRYPPLSEEEIQERLDRAAGR